jgi:ribosomal protein S18 acetylase RimI-like enzyme
MMSEARVTRAQPRDAAALTEIAFAAKRHWNYAETWIRGWADLLTITPEYLREHLTFLMATNREILGFAAIEFTEGEAVIQHLWVRPSAMRRGIGAALFAACETAAREAGATRLIVESDPHAEGFYQRMGAVTIGRVAARMESVERFLPRLEKRLG